MVEFEDSGTEDRKSKYNAAISQLYRLDDLWKSAHKHRSSSQLTLWNLDLDAVWLELSEDAKPEDEQKFFKFNQTLVENGFFIPIERIGFESIDKKDVLNQAKFYQILLIKEMWLRKMQNKQGKSTTYEDDLDSYMD